MAPGSPPKDVRARPGCATSVILPNMSDVIDIIDRHGGLAATHELLAAGFDRGGIRAELVAGRLQRVRQGWYSRRGIHADLLHAARVGGRLGCSSALRLRDVWVTYDGCLHVAVQPSACRLRSPGDAHRRLTPTEPVITHWTDGGGRSRLIVDDLSAIVQLSACVSPDHLAASADSLIHRRPQLRDAVTGLAQLAGLVPEGHRHRLAQVDGVCESGTETLFWLRMRRLAPQRQIWLTPKIRVDFLLGDRLVIEVDGKEFHSRESDFESDRRRDAELSALGYRVLRFSYRQMMREWPSVEAAVLAAVARGDRF